MQLLLRKLKLNHSGALIAAAIFCLHPMQSESVMWIAERKNVMFAFFYLLASLNFISWKEIKNEKKFYFLSLLFFILALLSKGLAVSFALSLFAFDIINGR